MLGQKLLSKDTMPRSIDYGTLMHRAMRGLIVEVLRGVEAEGLPGDHHFFITFDTRHPDAQLHQRLRDRYPEEMTIVIQNWYDNLNVDEDGFAITLNFGDVAEPLYVPFDAIRTFVDPSVEFGLRFETQETEDEDGGDGDDDRDPPPAAPRQDAEVVSLDKWRK